jgi:hypothetical protein
VLDAVLWIADARDKVYLQTITKYFAKAGFTSHQKENMTEDWLRLKIDSLFESLPSCRVTPSEIIEMDNNIPLFGSDQRRGRDNQLI